MLYVLRPGRDHFKVGDRLDGGVGLAYRLTESIKTFPQFSVFTEIHEVWLKKDEDHGEKDPNSGSLTLYVTPGFRTRFNECCALTIAPSLPVYQDVTGRRATSFSNWRSP